MPIPSNDWDCVDNIDGMKATEKALLTFLCRKANSKENYSSWYSVSEMARILCMSEKTIKRSTSSLEKLGLISKQRRRDTSSVYTVDLLEIRKQGVDNQIGKGQIDPRVGSLCPEGGVKLTYKDVIENVKENVITGGHSIERPDSNSQDLKIDYGEAEEHQAVIDFVFAKHGRNLSGTPSEREKESYEWANEFYDLDMSYGAFEFLCHFSIKELGEPHSILNPIVRLREAFEALELDRGEMEANNRFMYSWACFE